MAHGVRARHHGLACTLTFDAAAGSKHTYTLRRSGPSDEVTGTIALGFAWDITARSLLLMKLATLEGVLAQRVEILCMLRPTPSRSVQGWVEADAQAPKLEQVTLYLESQSCLRLQSCASAFDHGAHAGIKLCLSGAPGIAHAVLLVPQLPAPDTAAR